MRFFGFKFGRDKKNSRDMVQHISTTSEFDSFLTPKEKARKNAARLFFLMMEAAQHKSSLNAVYAFINETPEIDFSLTNPYYHIGSNKKESLLHAAVAYLPYVGLVQLLIEKGASTTVLNADGLTPFELAATKRSGVEMLYALSKDVPAEILNAYRNKKGETLFSETIKQGGCVFNYLQKLAEITDINLPNKEGQTPLGLCIHKLCEGYYVKQVYLPVVKMLSEKGAKLGYSEIIPVLYQIYASEFDKKEDLIAQLCAHHIDFKQKDTNGNNLLHQYVLHQKNHFNDAYCRVLSCLVRFVDINEKNKSGLTPLALACAIKSRKHYDFLSCGCFSEETINKSKEAQALLKFNPDIHTLDSKGNTILHLAIAGKNLELVQQFLTAFPELTQIKNKEGLLPIDFARDDKIVALFIDANLQQMQQPLSDIAAMKPAEQLYLFATLIQLYPETIKTANQLAFQVPNVFKEKALSHQNS